MVKRTIFMPDVYVPRRSHQTLCRENKYMAAKVPDWPKPQSNLLSEIVLAFQNRSKAIKYNLNKWTMDLEEDEGYERLNIDASVLLHNIRLSIWSDGAMWIRVCSGNKNGWVTNYSFDLDLGENSSSSVIDRFVETLIFFESNDRVEEIWSNFNPIK